LHGADLITKIHHHDEFSENIIWSTHIVARVPMRSYPVGI